MQFFFSAIKHIFKIQVLYNSKNALTHALPHVATRCESLAKEVLGFVCILLLNANQNVQVHALARACPDVASWEISLKVTLFEHGCCLLDLAISIIHIVIYIYSKQVNRQQQPDEQLMRLWHFSSSVNSLFKRTCAAIKWS